MDAATERPYGRASRNQAACRVKAIAGGRSAITRTSVAVLKARRVPCKVAPRKPAGQRVGWPLIDQANALRTRLESLLAQMNSRGPAAADDLATVRRRLADLAGRQGSDCPTPSSRKASLKPIEIEND
jgi:hypothetical protein